MSSGNTINIKDSSVIAREVDYRLFPKLLEQNFPGGKLFREWPITNGGYRENQMHPVFHNGREFYPPKNQCWSHVSRPVDVGLTGMSRVGMSGRLIASGVSLGFKRYYDDFLYKNFANWWDGFRGALDQVYVVQTNERLVERCLLMATDPGDLVLDPTCGSGTTATVAERWGRRWITLDTSRVALALARARLMGARYPYYLLSDSVEGRAKEQGLTKVLQPNSPVRNDLMQGFVYQRASYITSTQIANNAEIDVIWEEYQRKLEPLRESLNAATGEEFEEWEIPRQIDENWSDIAEKSHEAWWALRIARQKEIDASIARKADIELLYDRPYEDTTKIRVAGPFTVESLSPHRAMATDEEELGRSGRYGRGETETRTVAWVHRDGHRQPNIGGYPTIR